MPQSLFKSKCKVEESRRVGEENKLSYFGLKEFRLFRVNDGTTYQTVGSENTGSND